MKEPGTPSFERPMYETTFEYKGVPEKIKCSVERGEITAVHISAGDMSTTVKPENFDPTNKLHKKAFAALELHLDQNSPLIDPRGEDWPSEEEIYGFGTTG